MKVENTQNYDDIINLPHHKSTKHPHMSLHDRAAQFSPFAALTGHDAAVKETARLTGERMELDENVKARLNEKLQIIAERIDAGKNNLEKIYSGNDSFCNSGLDTTVIITYFVPDERKDGGEYVTVKGNVKKIDNYMHRIVMEDKTVIPIEQISEIQGEIFALLF